jgi:hypothetical protein
MDRCTAITRSASRLRALALGVIVCVLLLSACGATSATQKAEAHLAALANKVCREMLYPGRPRFPTRSEKLVVTLLYHDKELPRVRKLLADARVKVETHELLETRHLHYFQLQEKYYRQRERVGADLKAVGMTECAGSAQLP